MTSPLSYDSDHALNAICPYFTMFPLEYPVRIIRKHRRQTPVVCDPFCGRGTTIYAARRAGLHSYGFDVSAIAVAIARAKLASASADAIMRRAAGYLQIEPQRVPDQPFFREAYSAETLKELCSLREGLLGIRAETDESALLRAAVLGCLHGPRSKDVSKAGYFSNQMPRTFAPKPDYSIRYWTEHNLKPPKVSVLRVLRRKLDRISGLNAPVVGSFRHVLCADARDAAPYSGIRSPVLAITSPPYYGMRSYIQDQWLRHWLLGGPDQVDYDAKAQLHLRSHHDFILDLARVWSHLQRRANTVDLYVRFGRIPSVKSDAKELFKASLEESGGWRLVSTRRAKTANDGKRQADQMRRGSAPAEEFDFHAVAV